MTSGALSLGYAYGIATLVIVAYEYACFNDLYFDFFKKPTFLCLVFFGVFYVLFSDIAPSNIQNFLILPVLAHSIGWSCMRVAKNHHDQFLRCTQALAMGFAFNAILNYFVNIGRPRHQLTDFWTGELRRATGSGFLVTILLALLIYTIFLESKWILKILMLSASTVCIMYIFQLATRAQLLIFGISTAFALIYYLWITKRTRGILHAVGIISSVTIFFVLAINNNWFRLGNWVRESNMLARFRSPTSFLISNTERFNALLDGIRGLYLHPFGGQKSVYYRHNLWLDIGRVAGIIPVIVMIIYTLLAYKNASLVLRNDATNIEVKVIVLPLYIAFLIALSLEPILEGVLNFFLAFCLINGMVEGYHDNLMAEKSIFLPSLTKELM